MSHVAVTYHIVFGTHSRRQTIPIAHERELYKFIYDLSNKRDILIRRIGGMPDHIHILADIPPKIAVADYVRLIKAESSKFLRVNPHFPDWERWADGYGIFSVEAANRATRCEYIRNQKAHHHLRNYIEEYRELLIQNGYDIDSLTDEL